MVNTIKVVASVVILTTVVISSAVVSRLILSAYNIFLTISKSYAIIVPSIQIAAMVYCCIIKLMTFQPLKESHFILNALIIVTPVEFFTVAIIEEAVMPEFTNSYLFAKSILVASIPQIFF